MLKVPTSEDGCCIFCISFNWKYYILLTVVTSGLSPMFLPSYSCAAAMKCVMNVCFCYYAKLLQ